MVECQRKRHLLQHQGNSVTSYGQYGITINNLRYLKNSGNKNKLKKRNARNKYGSAVAMNPFTLNFGKETYYRMHIYSMKLSNSKPKVAWRLNEFYESMYSGNFENYS